MRFTFGSRLAAPSLLILSLVVLSVACNNEDAKSPSTPCEGGYCNVDFARTQPTPNDRGARLPSSLEVTRKLVPSNGKAMGLFSAPNDGDSPDCNEDVIDNFRKKAAALAFDGVAEIHLVVRAAKGERRTVRCYGTPFIR